MTAPDEITEPLPAVVSEAWWPLWNLACGENGERRDWDGPAVKVAMRLAHARGVPYRTARDTLLRLAGDLDARTPYVLAELTNLHRDGQSRGSPPAVIAALIAGDYESARKTMHTASVVPGSGAAAEDNGRNE